MTDPVNPTESAVLTTKQGRRVHAAISLDMALGVARYRVAEHDGTYSIGFDPGHYLHKCCERRSIEVTYGIAVDSPFARVHEDSPTVYRVRLAGRAVFHPSEMKDSHYWLSVTRDDGNHYHPPAPSGTRSRTADTVRALTTDFLARPWQPRLIEAHDQHHAQYRMSRHRDAIDALEPQLADLAHRWAEERAGLARQREILQTIPVPEDEFPEPTHILAA
jgi:hypothetical protein